MGVNDREALNEWWESDWPDLGDDVLDTLAGVVDRIATARVDAAVRAALEAAAEQIDLGEERTQDFVKAKGYNHAARIVRATIPTVSLPSDVGLSPPRE